MINARQFEEICDGVWSDREALLQGNGEVSGDAALVRAVFWRLCKAGINPKGCAANDAATPTLLAYQIAIGQMLKKSSGPPFDSGLILNALVERYQIEQQDAGA